MKVRKISDNKNFIKYVLNKDTGVELVFTNSDNLDDSTVCYDLNYSIIMKQGEFLLLFLNADFSNEVTSEETFFSFFSTYVRKKLKSFNNLVELLNFQSRLRNCVDFVFNYKTYTESYDSFFKDYIANASSHMSIAEYKENIRVLFDCRIQEKNNNYTRANETILKDFGYTHDIYLLDSISSLLYMMLKQWSIFKTLPIRKCKNCGKFFIAQNRKDELYCSNFFEDTGKTCKQLGSMATYMQKLENDPVLALYKNMTKRKYMRVKRNPDNVDMSKNFEEWKKLAKEVYTKYINNEISSNDFEEWLNKYDD